MIWKRYLSMFTMVSFIGAKDCGDPWSKWAPKKESPPPTPALPFCVTDPPLGCAAVCISWETYGFTEACSLPSADTAGGLTSKFIFQIDSMTAMLVAAGMTLCPDPQQSSFVTPCVLGITPVEVPGQDHAACQPSPAGCPLWVIQ